MDLRKPTVLGDVINKVPGGGYDYNFCLLDEFAAKVTHATSGRTLEVHTNQPGVQFYTANFFPETGGIPGKSGQKYLKHGAFCLETQNYPDAVNHVGLKIARQENRVINDLCFFNSRIIFLTA